MFVTSTAKRYTLSSFTPPFMYGRMMINDDIIDVMSTDLSHENFLLKRNTDFSQKYLDPSKHYTLFAVVKFPVCFLIEIYIISVRG